ncbi:MAG TPA: AMP-binding protein [Acidimicrobiales bacterium]|nr:AMP-binding protein [Acidimicrobiales bacterium]
MPDLVAIDLAGGPEFVDVLVKAWDAGDAVLPLDQRLSDQAKKRVVDAMRPARVVDATGEQRHAGVSEPVEAGDALVIATSGTTGEAKGVVLTMSAVEASARATSARLGVDPQRHRWLACLPLNHVGGLSVVTRSLVTGTPCTVLGGFDATRVEDAAGPDVFVSLVATALQRISALRFHTVVLGGSAPPAQVPPNVVTTYGMTETGSGVVYDGVPLDGVEVSVEAGASEIRLRCPMLLRCYRDGSVPLDAEGWFATGDSGRIDAAGRLQVHGRLTDLIISGGENVWPALVEAAIRSHPRVAEVAVAGVPDPEWGQRVVAWVVPTDSGEPPASSELRALVAEQVAPYAAPKEVVVVSELPKTSIGKVRRDRLMSGEASSER